MKTQAAFLLITAMFVFACAGPASTPGAQTPSSGPATTGPATAPPTSEPTPSEFRQGPEGFIADLTDAGADAAVADSFDGEPLAAAQTLVCVNGEEVRVFAYSSEQERLTARSQIDRTDPTHVGGSIVEWAGSPKFWQRDRIIVLYLGTSEDTINLLTVLMGEPFAQGQGRPAMLPSAC